MADKTPFAGYERLAPGDPLSTDAYRFQAVNPLLADRLGRLGAVTHRHDAHAALVDPTLAPTVTTGTGGSIPAATPISVRYTLLDVDGGETLPVDAVTVTTPAGYLDPTAAPAAAVDYLAGTLLAATVNYALTVRDGVGGETVLGPSVQAVIDPGHANAEVVLSGLTAITDASSGSDPAALWALWRQQGGGPWYLLGTGPAATDTFTDNEVAGNCTVDPPSVGTTQGTNSLSVSVPGGQPADAVNFNIYADFDGSFTSPALLGTYPIADAGGAAKVYTALVPGEGSPPPVSTCYPGANQINPATDILGGGGGGGWEEVTVPTDAASWDTGDATGTWDFSTPGEIAKTDTTTDVGSIWTNADFLGIAWGIKFDVRMDAESTATANLIDFAFLVNYQALFGALSGDGAAFHYASALPSAGEIFYYSGGSVGGDLTAPSAALAAWHTYEILGAGTTTAYVFVDGTLVGCVSGTGSNSASTTARFGLVASGSVTFRNLAVKRIALPTFP